jgi:hypothetical protein
LLPPPPPKAIDIAPPMPRPIAIMPVTVPTSILYRALGAVACCAMGALTATIAAPASNPILCHVFIYSPPSLDSMDAT